MGQHHLCNRSLCNGYLENGIFRETGCRRIYCFNVFLGNLKKTQNFGNFPNFRGGGPESLENSKLFLGFFFEGFPKSMCSNKLGSK